MYSFKSIVLIAAAITIGAECSAVPALAAAPLVAPAHVGYAHAVPQNIPPYASQVSVVNRALSPLIAAPFAAPLTAPLGAPLAAPLGAPLAAPFAAPIAAPFAGPSPYLAGPIPAPYGLPAAYAAAPAAYAAAPGYPAPGYAASGYAAPGYAAPGYAAPFPYSAPLLRSPYGYAPAYVR